MISMKVEFIDTNVLVYAYDSSAGRKHALAKDLIARLWADGLAATSVQVLQEFYVTVTRKVSIPLTEETARAILVDLGNWHLLEPGHATVLRAVDTATRYRVSFWDAMIIAAGEELEASVVWSEDLSHGQVYGRVEVRNPFVGTRGSA